MECAIHVNIQHGAICFPGATIQKNKRYVNYGGRGIKACARWLKFEEFFADMGHRPEHLTIERKNNDKGYAPDNCKWATKTEQARNTGVYKNNKTGIMGVTWHKASGKYQAHICANNKQKYLGLFASIADAKTARDQAEKKYWGEEMSI